MLKPFAKKLGYSLHSTVSRNQWLAETYLAGLGSVCRAAPDGAWKQFLCNSIHSVPWPKVRLKELTTRFPVGDLELKLVPYLDGLEFEAQFYRRLRYEHEVFGWLATRSYRTIIEIGANVGIFSVYFAKTFPDAMVYAFEPSPEAFSRLLKNAAANRCSNLSVFNCAIFSESGFLNFHEPAGHLTNGSLDPSFAAIFSPQVRSIPVPVLAASTMEPFFQGGSPILLKIDVEGAEPKLLQSLQGLIGRYRPDLIIEVLPVTEAALNELQFLRDGSYRRFQIRPEGLQESERFVATGHRDYALLPAQ